MQVCDLSLERFVLIAACACEGTRSQKVDKLSWVSAVKCWKKTSLFSCYIQIQWLAQGRAARQVCVAIELELPSFVAYRHYMS